jgi:hypothetical protein
MIIHLRDALFGVGRETITAYHKKHTKPTTYTHPQHTSWEENAVLKYLENLYLQQA